MKKSNRSFGAPGLALLLAAFVMPVKSAAQWSGLGSGLPSADRIVSAMAVDPSGNVCVAYRTIGFKEAQVAKWNGTSWTPMGPRYGNMLYAAVADYRGNTYVGGEQVSSSRARNAYVARWNGSGWVNIGAGLMPTRPYLPRIRALAADGSGNLYAGGQFITSGRKGCRGIAKWDGASWKGFGSGLGTDRFVSYIDAAFYPSEVYALALDGAGNLYIGGLFLHVGGVTAAHVARWNGSTWSAVGSGLSNNSGAYVTCLAADGRGNVYAGGAFTNAGGVAARRIARWDGVSWHALGSGLNATPDALATDSSGNLYAGGMFTDAGGSPIRGIARWDGATWTALDAGLGGAYYGTNTPYVGVIVPDVTKSSFFVGGNFSTAGGIASRSVAKWK